jgi:hypothetical protein
VRNWIIIVLVVLGIGFLNLFSSRLDSENEWPESMGASLASSWFWVQGYGAWLKKDEPRLIDSYRFATALNPSNLAYWRLAAQTIAFDLPVWNDDRSRNDYGRDALEFFENSRPYFKNDSEWFQTGAFIAETVVADRPLALGYLEEGVAIDEFPYLLGKSYARLLTESGKRSEALSFLRSWQPRLEGDAYPERPQEIAEWILSLEKEMKPQHSQ